MYCNYRFRILLFLYIPPNSNSLTVHVDILLPAIPADVPIPSISLTASRAVTRRQAVLCCLNREIESCQPMEIVESR